MPPERRARPGTAVAGFTAVVRVAPRPVSEVNVRVVTWNLWWRFGGQWLDRQPLVVKRLRAVAPDLVGLQEVWAAGGMTQADVIADALGMHAAFAAPSLPPVPVPPETPDQAAEILTTAHCAWSIRSHHPKRRSSSTSGSTTCWYATPGLTAWRSGER